jgi:hypothetical protein
MNPVPFVFVAFAAGCGYLFGDVRGAIGGGVVALGIVLFFTIWRAVRNK